MKIADAIDALTQRYGCPDPPITTDPFELILYENCAYLVDDERRLQVWNALKHRVGTRPADICDAPTGVIIDCIHAGGMQPERRAEKLKDAAAIAFEECGGDLNALIAGPIDQARRVLKKFPGIGDPGADKILASCGRLPVLALDSNGLRVLLRLGFGEQEKSYAKTYRSVQTALKEPLPTDVSWFVAAHQLLRQHGQTLCKTGSPRCDQCPLAPRCPSAGQVD